MAFRALASLAMLLYCLPLAASAACEGSDEQCVDTSSMLQSKVTAMEVTSDETAVEETPEDDLLETGDEATTKYIEGVPIYNYHFAHPGGMNPSVLELAEQRRWLLNFPDSYTDQDIRKFCEPRTLPGRARCEELGHPSEGGMDFAEITATEKELGEALKGHPDLKPKFIEPDTPVAAIPEVHDDEPDGDGTSLIEGKMMGVPWGLDRIDDQSGTDGTYSVSGSQGAGAHVYVADTGVRTTHQDFGGRAVSAIESLGTIRECYGSTSCARDTNGHGTHCAGTIGGKEYGVAKKTKLYGVKVLDPGGYASYIVQSLDWIASKGNKPAVWSASLGGRGTSKTYDNAFKKAKQAGITIVVAAGNENSNACNYQPAYSKNAITVGATQKDDKRTGFSNYGSCVDIFAPGRSIKSASHSSDTGPATMSGTSMACPHVAGVAALVLGDNPSLSPDGVWSSISNSAVYGRVSDPMGSPNYMLYAKGGGGGGNPFPSPQPGPSPSNPSPPPPSGGGGSGKCCGQACTLGDCASGLICVSLNGGSDVCHDTTSWSTTGPNCNKCGSNPSPQPSPPSPQPPPAPPPAPSPQPPAPGPAPGGQLTECGFESSGKPYCGVWSQSGKDKFDWTRQTGKTDSGSTGPKSANKGKYYVYIEASSPRKSGDKATLETCGPLGDGAYLRFHYHMYGKTIGGLKVEFDGDKLWEKKGAQGNSWKMASVDLGKHAGSNGCLRITGTRGSSYTGDIGIDDVVLNKGSAGSKPSPKPGPAPQPSPPSPYPKPQPSPGGSVDAQLKELDEKMDKILAKLDKLG